MHMDDTRFAADFVRSFNCVFVDLCLLSGGDLLASGRFAYNPKLAAQLWALRHNCKKDSALRGTELI